MATNLGVNAALSEPDLQLKREGGSAPLFLCRDQPTAGIEIHRMARLLNIRSAAQADIGWRYWLN